MSFLLFIPLFAFTCILMFALIGYAHVPFFSYRKIHKDDAGIQGLPYVFVSMLVFALIGNILDRIEFVPESSLTTKTVKAFGIIVFYDLYFYLTHRLLHLPVIHRTVHHIHHRYDKPGPWSAFAFHPIEAFIQIGIFIPIVWIFQPDIVLTKILIGTLLFLTVYGHSGIELRGRKLPVFDIFTTSIFHNLHHSERNRNYGIFLILWDRIWNTVSSKYDPARRAFRDKLGHQQASHND